MAQTALMLQNVLCFRNETTIFHEHFHRTYNKIWASCLLQDYGLKLWEKTK